MTSISRPALAVSCLPKTEWVYALRDAADKYNNPLHSILDASPAERFFASPHPLDSIHAFGWAGQIPKLPQGSKLDNRGTSSKFLLVWMEGSVPLWKRGRVPLGWSSDFYLYKIRADPTATTRLAFHIEQIDVQTKSLLPEALPTPPSTIDLRHLAFPRTSSHPQNRRSRHPHNDFSAGPLAGRPRTSSLMISTNLVPSNG